MKLKGKLSRSQTHANTSTSVAHPKADDVVDDLAEGSLAEASLTEESSITALFAAPLEGERFYGMDLVSLTPP